MKDNNKINARQQSRELSRLQKIKEKNKGKYYFAVLIILILLVDVIDNITTNATGSVTSAFIREFFIDLHILVFVFPCIEK